jgi:hypothetical protein
MHLDDERIQRVLHGELGSVETETRLHLEACDGCRDLLEEARSEEARIFGLFGRLDHRLPSAPNVSTRREESVPARWGRVAASILMAAVLAGVAYAAPGSPVPHLVERLLGSGAVERGRPPVNQPGHPPRAGGGIAVAPSDGLVIELAAAGPDAEATVALSNGDEVVVRAAEGTATFGSDPGRLSVLSSQGARLEILVPRSATSVEVRVRGIPVFRKLANGAVTALPRDSTGHYRILLQP